MECRNLWSGHTHYPGCETATYIEEPVDVTVPWMDDDLFDEDHGYWTTRDGQCLRIQDMSDSHLANTIRFLHRQIADGERANDEAPDGVGGFGAAIASFEVKVAELEEDADRRGLVCGET